MPKHPTLSKAAIHLGAAARVLLLLVTVLLVATMPTDRLGSLTHVDQVTEVGATEVGACDCCPDGEDCCETEGGLCCATGTSAALLSTVAQPAQILAPVLQGRVVVSEHLFLPRANGPPPTPPPIA